MDKFNHKAIRPTSNGSRHYITTFCSDRCVANKIISVTPNEIQFINMYGKTCVVRYNDDGKPTYHREGTKEYTAEYDKNGNIIKTNRFGHIDELWEYDDSGNMIYYKDPYGCETWYEYDSNKLVKMTCSSGFYKRHEYDKNGKLIYSAQGDISRDGDKVTITHEEWKDRDENGKVIHYKESRGFESWKDRDENGKVIHYKDTCGFESSKDRDENGKVIHYEDNCGNESWIKYDKNGKEIHFIHRDGTEEWRDRDDKGRVIHYRNHDGIEKWKEYNDDCGKISKVITTHRNGNKTIKEYEYYPDGKMSQRKITKIRGHYTNVKTVKFNDIGDVSERTTSTIYVD